MQLLEDRIRKDGKVREGNVLKVDSFLNHQMDVNLFREIGKEFQRRFAGEEITKILTIEASGIGIACVVAEIFNVPVVFAKKTQTKNIAGDVYTTKVESFTHGRVYDIIVSKEFLGKGDKVLLIDDFLANGKALEGLATLVQDSGASFSPRECSQFRQKLFQYANHSRSVSGSQKNSSSICSNSRVRNVKLPGVISLRKDLPI